jgi:hypothetical protein
MLLRRVLAVAVAVGLVVGAWQLRARLFGADGPDGPDQAPADLRVACVRELAQVCEALDASSPPLVEEAATTVARFRDSELPFDVWLTLDPWPTLAANAHARARQAELTQEVSAVLARTPVVLAVHADRLAPMQEVCEGTLAWRCLGERADEPWADLGGESTWGRVKVGIDRPAERAGGLLTLAEATASYFGGAEFNTQSLSSPDFFSWLSDLAAAVDTTANQSPFERMLLTGSAEYEFVGVLESNAVPLLRQAPGRARQIVLQLPEPLVTADVVAVGYGAPAEDAVARVVEQVTGPLADSGWRVPDAAPPSEVEGAALPEDNGLPSAAALEALQQTWAEVAR